MDDYGFIDDEKQYIEIKLSGAKLTELEYEAKFGEQRYQQILLNDDIRRYLADQKLAKAKKKEASRELKLDLLIDRETRKLGLDVIKQIANDPEHKDRFNAAKVLARGDESYIAQKGKQLAESEGDQIEEKIFKWAYTLSNEE